MIIAELKCYFATNSANVDKTFLDIYLGKNSLALAFFLTLLNNLSPYKICIGTGSTVFKWLIPLFLVIWSLTAINWGEKMMSCDKCVATMPLFLIFLYDLLAHIGWFWQNGDTQETHGEWDIWQTTPCQTQIRNMAFSWYTSVIYPVAWIGKLQC